ncbi:MAG TPA: Ig-like domain-containing protein [Acidimicrobiales bacterium]|nr:Ig-like domain-containing protein [Acidimicrobiales bacterium]
MMRLFSRRTVTWVAGSALVLGAVAVVGGRAGTQHLPMKLTSGTDFSISGTVTGLEPGSPGSLELTVTNPHSVAITVTTLSVSVGTPTPPGCDASNLDLTGAQYSSATGFNVGPDGGTATAPPLPVSLRNLSGNQDGCKGVTFPLVYSGTARYTQVFSTTTSLSSSVNPSVSGQSVTFTATVTAGAPQQGSGSAPGGPTGSVAFKDGAVVLGTSALASNGTAQLSTSSLAVGTHAVTAQFSNTPLVGTADGNFAGSTSSPVSQVVNNPKKASSTTVASSLNPSAVGQAVTLTATVTPQATGTVTFYDNGVPLGAAQPLARGQAAVTTSSLAAGTHPITASYSGDATYFPSTSSTLAQVVNAKAATATTLSATPNPSVFGQPVSFTATVTSGSGTPTGSVTFSAGATTLGSATVNGKGVATLTSSALPAGTSTVTAAYSGDATFAASSATVGQTVNKATPVVTLTSSNNPSRTGQSVTFTITVTGTGPQAPTGSVTVAVDGAAVATRGLGAPLTYTTSSLSVGSHSVTATYSGDGNYTTGPVASVTQKVVK